MKNIIIGLSLNLLLNCTSVYSQETMKTDTFSFSFEGKRLRGFIDLPTNQVVRSIIIIVPGDGKTHLNWYNDIRSHFVKIGIACCEWDKMGCGESEGEYHQQPVQNSADEVLAAIEELKHRNIEGSDKIGFWGISRAGWICPLVIQKYPIAYWISVSGTDDKENFAYLLESNFRALGKSEDEIKMLVGEWFKGEEIFRNGGSPEQYLAATEHLQKDSFCIKNFGYGKINAEEYKRNQENSKSEKQLYDKETGLMIYIPNFKDLLNKIQCPVLAIFGEKDCNVDWRKTLALYKETIGSNKATTLTIKTFPDGNHGILKCKTGGINEKFTESEKHLYGYWQECDGYYDTMLNWLTDKGFGKKTE